MKKFIPLSYKKEKHKIMGKRSKKKKKHNRTVLKINKPKKMKKGALTSEEMMRLCDSITICTNQARVVSYSYSY